MIVSRFAPSPTGLLHLGHAYSAVRAWRAAQSANGRFLLRIEDLDPQRSRPAFIAAIVEDLRWLGLEWDGDIIIQSDRAAAHAGALDRLRTLGLVYPCFCTRADIAAASTAPHGRDGIAYPGTCRGLADDPKRRLAQPHSWRLDSTLALQRAGEPAWSEGERRFAARPQDLDDVILARKDAPSSYHLACVVDDAHCGVNMVVRSVDLRPATPVQRLLQGLLDLPEPGYAHHALVCHDDGRRLAKRDRAPTLAAVRAEGVDGRALAQSLAMDLMPSGFRLSDD